MDAHEIRVWRDHATVALASVAVTVHGARGPYTLRLSGPWALDSLRDLIEASPDVEALTVSVPLCRGQQWSWTRPEPARRPRRAPRMRAPLL